jgi:hypothetical protein
MIEPLPGCAATAHGTNSAASNQWYAGLSHPCDASCGDFTKSITYIVFVQFMV